MTRVVLRDPAAVVAGVVEALRKAERATPAGAPFTLALSGGSTPKRLYEALGPTDLDWSRTHVFFGDERAVAPDDGSSNFRMASEALLSRVPAQVHRMKALEGDAAGYAEELRRAVPTLRDGVPVLDVVLLGMGADGHTASLFPGTTALAEASAWVVMNEVPQLGTRRMTLTFPVLNAAKQVWVLVTGADKAAMLARVEAGDTSLPIQRVQPTHGELVWWLDEAAAASR